MKINNKTKFLIVGLGLIGGSYARGLTKGGFDVYAISDKQESIDYAMNNKIIKDGAAFVNEEMIKCADIIVLALYPEVLLEWIEKYGGLIDPGTLVTDVTGVKQCIVETVQNSLSNGVEFISAHPMAGREVYGVENSDERIFFNANYIVVPTERNTEEAINTCKHIGELLKFSQISVISVEKHDEMIAFLSQLAHCIAVCLMACNTSEHLEKYTGDSFRDLTRIANINEYMWTELFLLNKVALLNCMQSFIKEFEKLRDFIKEDNVEEIYKMMRTSTERRELFNKKETNL